MAIMIIDRETSVSMLLMQTSAFQYYDPKITISNPSLVHNISLKFHAAQKCILDHGLFSSDSMYFKCLQSWQLPKPRLQCKVLQYYVKYQISLDKTNDYNPT